MYQPGIPTGLINLDVDYQNIQNNFQQLDTTYGTDHVAYSEAENNGYHNIIRLVPNSTPSAITNIGQLFDSTVSDGINTDQTLYFLTGGNRLIQLTRNFVPVANANGYTFLPGGLILQWGNFNPNSSTTVTFPLPFPGNIFNLQLTGSASNNSTFRNGVSTGTLTKTGFTWQGTIDSHWTPIYYMAIGN
jgi:hypothetical protein